MIKAKNSFDLGKFVKEFKRASDIIRMENPDYIFAPLVGAVPFVDILNIIDKKFPNESVHYLPNSSRFENRNELMKRWYSNFYKKNEIGEKMKVLCLDEVLYGSSAVNGYHQFKESIQERAKERAKGASNELEAIEYYKKKLTKSIDYKIIGIAEKNYRRNNIFTGLLNKKRVYLIELDEVPTIDNVNLNPIRLKAGKTHNGRISYLPEIETFDITQDYMNFLRNIATYVGVNPANVSPTNLGRIEEGIKQATE